LQSAILVSDRTGDPLGVLYEGLRADDGLHSTRSENRLPQRSHLDELGLTMRHVESLGLAQPVVHIIDREADSVHHFRRWEKQKRALVVRADDIRRVQHEGQDKLLRAVIDALEQAGGFNFTEEVEIKGQRARQFVAETEVRLHRAAKLHRRRHGQTKRQVIAGKAITLRLVVSQIRSQAGEVLAQWLLWTNVGSEVRAEVVAKWYYWRWKIESFFKLLKSAGQHLEEWQQESAEALAKRLVVATQACVMVWALAQSSHAEADKTRQFLVRLSGRLMKRGKAFTRPALLSGMWVLLAMLDSVERYSVAEIKEMAAVLPQLMRYDSG
jgi:hypothetical protein